MYTISTPWKYGIAMLMKIATSMGIMTRIGMTADLKLIMTTRNTPARDRMFTFS